MEVPTKRMTVSVFRQSCRRQGSGAPQADGVQVQRAGQIRGRGQPAADEVEARAASGTFDKPIDRDGVNNHLSGFQRPLSLQADISTIARKTGITSATQLAKLVPKDAEKGRVPDVEWWDAHIMANAEYPAEESANFDLREGAVTKLIEHPIQMMPLEPRNQGGDSMRFIYYVVYLVISTMLPRFNTLKRSLDLATAT